MEVIATHMLTSKIHTEIVYKLAVVHSSAVSLQQRYLWSSMPTCLSVIGPMLRSLQTTSSWCTLIFFLMKRSRCFWFIHDAAWTWVSTWRVTPHVNHIYNSHDVVNVLTIRDWCLQESSDVNIDFFVNPDIEFWNPIHIRISVPGSHVIGLRWRSY